MVQIRVLGNWTEEPTTERIFGNFIESGFGRQVTGLWSEMLYNRAFREIEEYRKATWEWLGLDREHYNEQAPFWHSGYEECDWELIGTPFTRHSCGNYTYKGLSSYLIENRRQGDLCGVFQKGLHMKSGKKYRLRVFAGIQGDIGRAGLNGFGDTKHSDKEYELWIKIGSIQKQFLLNTVSKEFTWDFTWNEPDEESTISLTFDFEGTLILAYTSLMPEDNLYGWRRDAVEKMQEVAPSVVRFPGGCFVSFYNWESSVGNRDIREPQPSFYWGGIEENDVGLDEFLTLSKLVGFEPQICFNMMTSIPFKARQMVEYLNASQDVGMGRLRMLNGHAEAYGVKLFEMDNEPGRKWTAEQYAWQCVAFAREMRKADTAIEFMLAAYAYDPKLLPLMLEIAGKDINYVIYRQGNPEYVSQILPVIKEYNRRNNTKLKLANTEWLPSCKSIEPFENKLVPTNFSWHAEITNDYNNIFSTQQTSWNYALNGAHRLLEYISYGGMFALANFNNMCNTWGQNVIEATKDNCYLSCMGHIFAFFHRVFRPCTASLVRVDKEGLYALATRSNKDGVMQLYIINHLSEKQKLSLPYGKWKCMDGLIGSGRIVKETATEKCVMNYIQEPEGQSLTMAPLSVICLIKQES